MRKWLVALAFALSAPAAFAQTAGDQHIADYAEERDARAIASFLLIESGVLDLSVDLAAQGRMATLRPEIEASALSAPAKERMIAYFSNFGSLMREEIGRNEEAMVSDTARFLIDAYTPGELAAGAAYFRAPAGRSYMQRLILLGVRIAAAEETGAPPPPESEREFSPEERAAIEMLVSTPEGVAFVQRFPRTMQSASHTIQRAIYGAAPPLYERIQREACDLLGEECPVYLESGLGR